MRGGRARDKRERRRGETRMEVYLSCIFQSLERVGSCRLNIHTEKKKKRENGEKQKKRRIRRKAEKKKRKRKKKYTLYP